MTVEEEKRKGKIIGKTQSLTRPLGAYGSGVSQEGEALACVSRWGKEKKKKIRPPTREKNRASSTSRVSSYPQGNDALILREEGEKFQGAAREKNARAWRLRIPGEYHLAGSVRKEVVGEESEKKKEGREVVYLGSHLSISTRAALTFIGNYFQTKGEKRKKMTSLDSNQEDFFQERGEKVLQ